MDKETAHVVHLPDEAPGVSAKVLANEYGIPRNDERVRHNVKVRPKRFLEYSRPTWVVAILRLNVAFGPVAVDSVGFNCSFIISSALC